MTIRAKFRCTAMSLLEGATLTEVASHRRYC